MDMDLSFRHGQRAAVRFGYAGCAGKGWSTDHSVNVGSERILLAIYLNIKIMLQNLSSNHKCKVAAMSYSYSNAIFIGEFEFVPTNSPFGFNYADRPKLSTAVYPKHVRIKTLIFIRRKAGSALSAISYRQPKQPEYPTSERLKCIKTPAKWKRNAAECQINVLRRGINPLLTYAIITKSNVAPCITTTTVAIPFPLSSHPLSLSLSFTHQHDGTYYRAKATKFRGVVK